MRKNGFLCLLCLLLCLTLGSAMAMTEGEWNSQCVNKTIEATDIFADQAGTTVLINLPAGAYVKTRKYDVDSGMWLVSCFDGEEVLNGYVPAAELTIAITTVTLPDGSIENVPEVLAGNLRGIAAYLNTRYSDRGFWTSGDQIVVGDKADVPEDALGDAWEEASAPADDDIPMPGSDKASDEDEDTEDDAEPEAKDAEPETKDESEDEADESGDEDAEKTDKEDAAPGDEDAEDDGASEDDDAASEDPTADDETEDEDEAESDDASDDETDAIPTPTPEAEPTATPAPTSTPLPADQFAVPEALQNLAIVGTNECYLKEDGELVKVRTSTVAINDTNKKNRTVAFIKANKERFAYLYAEPNNKSRILGRVTTGSLVGVIKAGNKYSRVYVDGVVGCVLSNTLTYMTVDKKIYGTGVLTVNGAIDDEETVDLLSSNSKGYTEATLPCGLEVTIWQKKGKFYEIEANGFHGWVNQTDLTVGNLMDSLAPSVMEHLILPYTSQPESSEEAADPSQGKPSKYNLHRDPYR